MMEHDESSHMRRGLQKMFDASDICANCAQLMHGHSSHVSKVGWLMGEGHDSVILLPKRDLLSAIIFACSLFLPTVELYSLLYKRRNYNNK